MTYSEIYSDIEHIFDKAYATRYEKLIILLADYVGEKVYSEKQALINEFTKIVEGARDEERRSEGRRTGEAEEDHP